jgi:RNA polymerase sigma factor for flagellar operon FliA
MLDELRALDWVPRSTRNRIREVDEIRHRLATALGRAPTLTEIATELGTAVKEVDATIGNANRAIVLSIQGFGAGVLANTVADRWPGPEEILLLRERVGYVRDAVAALTPRQQAVVVQHLFLERPIADIAIELRVTPSRVSQILTTALGLIRDGVNAHLDPDLVHIADDLPGSVVARRRAAYFRRIAARGDLRSRLAATEVPRPRR